MKAAMFDLDDTLYDEMDFVKSGFWAVSEFLSKRHGFTNTYVFDRLLENLREYGRGSVFDIFLDNEGINSPELIKTLVFLYRTHRPNIALFKEVKGVIDALKQKGFLTGLITDGMGCVQRNKIGALKIEPMFDVIVCTDEIGKEFWKPSKVPFQTALILLNAQAENSFYVGDNLSKDFLAPIKLGMGAFFIDRNKKSKVVSNNDLLVIDNLEDILKVV